MKKVAKLASLAINSALFLALIIGLPIALVVYVGWPGPTAQPNLDTITAVVTGREPIPALFVIKSIAIIGWVLWVQLVLAAAEEIRAARLDLAARKSFTLPGLQRLAATAILAITILLNGLKPAAASSLEPIPTAAVTQPYEQTQPEAAPKPDESKTKTYTTKEGDSWWSVSQSILGDGARFDELRQLNTGKTFNGTKIDPKSDYLGVGWEIVVPADANLETIVVQPGDTVSELEARHGLDYGDLTKENNLPNPDQIQPGQKLQIPPDAPVEGAEPVQPVAPEAPVEGAEPVQPVAPEAPVEGAEPVQPVAPEAPVGVPGSPRGSNPDDGSLTENRQDNAGTPDEESFISARKTVGVLLVAMALLGPAIYRIRRNRTRAQHRTVAANPIEFDEIDEQQTANLEAAVSYGDHEFIKVVLQLVGQRMAHSRVDPGIQAVLVGPNAARIVFDDNPSFKPGPGFEQTDLGWRVKRPTTLGSMTAQASTSPVPCPAVVSLGAKDDAVIAVNLEQLGGLNLIGTQTEVTEVMFNIMVELAASDLAETMQIVAVGFDRSLPKGLGRVEEHETIPSDFVAGEKSDYPALDRLLTVDSASSEPVIVISPTLELPTELLHSGIIPVVANNAHGALRDLEVDGSQLHLRSLGLEGIERPTITPEQITDLLEPNASFSNDAFFEPPEEILRPAPRYRTRQSLPQDDNQPTADTETDQPVFKSMVSILTADEPNQEDSLDSVDPEIVLSPAAVAARATAPIPSALVDFAREVQEEHDNDANSAPTGSDDRQKVDSSHGIEPIPTDKWREAIPQTPNTTTPINEAFKPITQTDLGVTFMVSVLGPIRMDGTGLGDSNKPWKYSKTPELLALLATSDKPRSTDELKDRLWPAEDPTKSRPRLSNAASNARRAVVGEERFPRLEPGATQYQLKQVGTDLDLFNANIEKAKQTDSPVIAMQYRQAALNLVEGVPFDSFASSASGYGWAEPLANKAIIDITNTAVCLAQWHLENMRPTEAAEAAEAGLKASPENYHLANLYGKASLATEDDGQVAEALMKIMTIESAYTEGDPGIEEQQLPEELSETQRDLQRRVQVETA